MLEREHIFSVKKGRGVLKSVFRMLFLSLILHCAFYAARQSLLQQGIADEVLRFHVLANSDSEEDQRVKYLVRDEVMEWMNETVSGDGLGRAQLLEFLTDHQEELVYRANEVLKEEDVSYRASAAFETCWFPDRTYGTCTFPAGYYEALRLKLGEAEGQNWWCVLYPGLCFRDCVHAVAEEEQMVRLEEVLTEEEYESLLKKPSGWKIGFRWF